MDREGTEANAGGRPDGDRLGWGRILYYLLFVLLAAFALTLLFGFVYDLLGYRRAPGALSGLSWLSSQALLVVAFAVLAYRTPRRPLAHVLVLALLVGLASVALPGFSASFVGWLLSGALVGVWALVGFGAGVGLRRASRGPGERPPE